MSEWDLRELAKLPNVQASHVTKTGETGKTQYFDVKHARHPIMKVEATPLESDEGGYGITVKRPYGPMLVRFDIRPTGEFGTIQIEDAWPIKENDPLKLRRLKPLRSLYEALPLEQKTPVLI